MATKNEESWLFIVEWYDPLPQMTKQYLLKYFPASNQAEMIDVKNRKLFLKRSPCPPELTTDDFYIGSQIVFFSRDLKIVDYGDIITKNKLFRSMEENILIITSSFSSYSSWGIIIDTLTNRLNYSIVKMKSIVMNDTVLNGIQKIETLQSLPRDNRDHIKDEPYLIIRLQKENGLTDLSNDVSVLLDTIAPQQSLIYTVNNKIDYNTIDTLLFDPKSSPMPSATYDNCTCCIIKPHIVKSKQVGKLLHDIISEGYDISAIQSIFFTKAQAEEFLEVYKGVVPEYTDHVLQLTSGISIALELRAQSAVSTFRQSAGPWDIEMAKELRPKSLRAKYGLDVSRNAIHCTDLDTDGIVECEYCFKIMS